LKEASYAAAGVISFPFIVSASALGKAGSVAASERIVMGCIGMGNQGTAHMGWRGGGVPNLGWVEPGGFMGSSEVQMVAVCDVDERWRNRARDIANKYYGNNDCAAYTDFRELLGRQDIDAVVTATPSHWNAIVDIAAAKAGKDIYCEKPMSLTIAEARAMANAVKRYGRVFQIGTQQRSDMKFRFACELVRNGYIGEVKSVTVGVGGPAGVCNLPGQGVPDYLDLARPGTGEAVPSRTSAAWLDGILGLWRRRNDELGTAPLRYRSVGPGDGPQRPGRNHSS